MVFKVLVTLLLSLLSSIVVAQNRTLKGSILDRQTKQPIPAASVMLKSKENKILSFKTTDRKGQFLLEIKQPDDELFLEINHLGYKKYNHLIKEYGQPIAIELEPN